MSIIVMDMGKETIKSKGCKLLLDAFQFVSVIIIIIIIQFNSLFIYVLNLTANGQLQSARIQTTVIRQHRIKQKKGSAKAF
jgi:hypothetical protein